MGRPINLRVLLFINPYISVLQLHKNASTTTTGYQII